MCYEITVFHHHHSVLLLFHPHHPVVVIVAMKICPTSRCTLLSHRNMKKKKWKKLKWNCFDVKVEEFLPINCRMENWMTIRSCDVMCCGCEEEGETNDGQDRQTDRQIEEKKTLMIFIAFQFDHHHQQQQP